MRRARWRSQSVILRAIRSVRNPHGRSTVAKSTEQLLEEAVAETARLADLWTNGEAASVALDLSASGEVPFRVVVPDETLPLVGMATLPPRSER